MQENLGNQNNECKTLADLENKIKSVLVVKDPGIIKLLAATVIASRMEGDPVFLFVVGKSSGGKCLGKGTLVRMYNGDVKKVEDIKQGELIMGDDSKPRTVLSTTKGIGKLYKVKQDNGEDYVVNDAHILSLRHSYNIDKVIDINIEELLQKKDVKKYLGYKNNLETSNLDIENFGVGEYFGFEIDGNKRFLLADNTVTHNTEFVNLINDLKFVTSLDTLTSNTFASGAKSSGGGETSLLRRIKNGILSIKDFTTILDMNETSRKEIMSQLRVIFDGSFNKETGTGESIKWAGKISMIAAVTSIIHQRGNEYKSMGERFMNYEIEQPTEEEVQERVMQNTYDMKSKRLEIQKAFTEYINHVLDDLEDEEVHINKDQERVLKEVSKYCTAARSGLEVHPRDDSRITFIPDKEGSSRVLGQLFALVRAFIAIRKIEPKGKLKTPKDEEGKDVWTLTEDEMNILKKIAFCSIPRKRRQALQILAKHESGATTAGIAMKLNYNTMVIRSTMYELNALDFCTRTKDGMTDTWFLNDDWIDLIREHEGIKPTKDSLLSDDGNEDYTEMEEGAEDLFSDDF